MDSMVKMSPLSEGRRIVRAALKLLGGIVFLGWLMLWIMSPTNTYRQIWLLELRAKANSTYFGAQGSTLLVFTFPILFIAVLGCLYLHLGKRSGIGGYIESWYQFARWDRIYPASYVNQHHRNGENRLQALWSRPVLVKGPLGIVSATELAFLSMFIALLIWSFSAYLQISFSKITAQSAQENGEKVWEAKLESTALRLGLIGNICLAFLFFPVTRGSSILQLVGITFEASIKYHIWLGNMVMTFFTAHGICYIIYWAATNQISEMLKWDKIGVSNLAGELALLAGLAMWATSYQRIRRQMFELFFYTHYVYLLFIFFFVLHVGMSYFCITFPGIYLFLVDRYLRFLQSRRRVRLVSARLLPCETVELNFSKSPGLIYTPSSIVFINVPSVSSLQWHPFTVSSNCNMEPEKLSVIIKSEGSWSRKLYQTLSAPSSIDRLDVSVEGPYGLTSTHFLRHDFLVLVSGGSGITPFISIIRELIFRSATMSHPTPKVLLICAFKNSAELTMLDLLSPAFSTQVDISRLQLQIEAFITREKQPTLDTQKHIRSIWFKPSPSDSPISAVLGPNSWLWLGAIISTSFVMFLLLLGICIRYYIYPIDHNTNQIYSYSSRSLLNMLFICFCITMMASAAFLWSKRHNAMEAKKIKNTDAATPTTSPGSWFYNADRELKATPTSPLFKLLMFILVQGLILRRYYWSVKDQALEFWSVGSDDGSSCCNYMFIWFGR